MYVGLIRDVGLKVTGSENGVKLKSDFSTRSYIVRITFCSTIFFEDIFNKCCSVLQDLSNDIKKKANRPNDLPVESVKCLFKRYFMHNYFVKTYRT